MNTQKGNISPSEDNVSFLHHQARDPALSTVIAQADIFSLGKALPVEFLPVVQPLIAQEPYQKAGWQP